MKLAPKLLTALLFAVVSAPAAAQTADAPLATKRNAEEGTYLVAGNGFALYLFKADTQGAPDGSGATSARADDCLGVWPPVVVDGQPVGGDGIDKRLLRTTTRADGLVQLTYNGWPLYFYAEDTGPEDIKGDDIESFGEDWYLIGPMATAPGTEARGDSPQPSGLELQGCLRGEGQGEGKVAQYALAEPLHPHPALRALLPERRREGSQPGLP
ncbi:MAG: putative lipoprotein [Devosia sp.]|uniref:COG4315 family predicted lipoprotein n=1 Tax=Devosia sp. TaxID=1871048 RepID=UPI00260207CC|nr:hypothetical protein [Devosia sp.]MDB5541205.1 putative lipoprotein [Devosia sp.]